MSDSKQTMRDEFRSLMNCPKCNAPIQRIHRNITELRAWDFEKSTYIKISQREEGIKCPDCLHDLTKHFGQLRSLVEGELFQ